MPTEAKRENITALAEALAKADAIYVAEYRGLSVAKSTELRKAIRNAGGEMKVCKNTLMRLALDEAGMIRADGIDTGPNGYILSYGHVAEVAKAIRDFAKVKENAAFVVKGGILGKDMALDQKQVFALADLPSREELLAKVVGLLAGPMRGLVTVLSGPARGLVNALSALKDKKSA